VENYFIILVCAILFCLVVTSVVGLKKVASKLLDLISFRIFLRLIIKYKRTKLIEEQRKKRQSKLVGLSFI